jgi:mevalonate kinase
MANNHELKYKLPERFHERVLKLEILIEQQKDAISHEHLKQLTELYSVCHKHQLIFLVSNRVLRVHGLS